MSAQRVAGFIDLDGSATACTPSVTGCRSTNYAESPPPSTRPGSRTIEVAHGDGLAGSSLTYGPASSTDGQWIAAAAEVITRARLTTLLLPEIGTIPDLVAAHDLGVTSVRVATHATEADIAEQHIAKARDLGMDVSGFLMMSHMADPDLLARQAKLMADAGAHCVYVTHSGGRLTMREPPKPPVWGTSRQPGRRYRRCRVEDRFVVKGRSP